MPDDTNTPNQGRYYQLFFMSHFVTTFRSPRLVHGSEQTVLSYTTKSLCIPKIQNCLCLSPCKCLPMFRNIIVPSSSGSSCCCCLTALLRRCRHYKASMDLPIGMTSYRMWIHSRSTVWTSKLEMTKGLPLGPLHDHLLPYTVCLNKGSAL